MTFAAPAGGRSRNDSAMSAGLMPASVSASSAGSPWSRYRSSALGMARRLGGQTARQRDGKQSRRSVLIALAVQRRGLRALYGFGACSANAPPCGSRATAIQSPFGTSIGPFTIDPPRSFTATAAGFTSATLMYESQRGGAPPADWLNMPP